MKQEDIVELLQKTVAEIEEDLPALNKEELKLAHQLESQDDNPRTGVLEPIENLLGQIVLTETDTGGEAEKELNDARMKISDLESRLQAAPQPTAEAGAKEARGESIPDWQRPDYDGPITGEQGEWRNKNLTAE